MGEEELEDLTVCVDCGLAFDLGLQRGYVFLDQALCPVCATRRGGVYDDEREEWVTPPDVRDLYNPS